MTWVEPAARWYLTLLICTWALAPAVSWLCRALSDRGASVARPIALLAAIYPAWLFTSLGIAPFSPWLVIATILTGGVIGWIWLVRGPGLDRTWFRALFLTESASLALFAVYLWLRGYTPQILGTEKPMDVAFLASSARTLTMPPPDPWFAGAPINYYYLGYLQHGTISRIAGVPPEIGFNLALATIFSMTAVAAFGVAWNVVRPRFGSALATGSGLLAAFGVAIAGNLYAPLRLLQDAQATLDAWWWDSAAGIGWRSSRIVCDGPRIGNECLPPSVETINEFPFFSFLLGDLHPHLMALPFTIVALALAWNLARQTSPDQDLDAPHRAWVGRVACCGVVVGALLALNTWDYPAFMAACLFGLVVGHGGSLSRSWRPILLMTGVSVVAWLPYLARYDPPTHTAMEPFGSLPLVSSLASAIALHLGERTSVAEYLTIFGAPYVVGTAFAVVSFLQRRRQSSPAPALTLLISIGGILVAGVLLSAPVIVLCGVPLLLAVDLLRASRQPTPETFVLGALSLAWGLSIVVEIVFVRDAFNDRMNTLFKFYFQTWTLYAIAAAVSLSLLWSLSRSRWWQRAAIAAFTCAALLAGLAYPLIASYQWTEHFTGWRGLDGLAYGDAQNAGDVAAIRWLAEHAEPGDIILEAAGCSYRPFSRLPLSRVSAFTGLPTIIGWDNHERQWRAGQSTSLAEIPVRQDDVRTMLSDPQSPLFSHYGVRWVVIGPYELGDAASECPAAGPSSAFAAPEGPGPGWRVAFQSGETHIYAPNNQS